MDDMDPTLKAYVQSPELAENYDEYFSDTPLFTLDCRYIEAVLDLPKRPESQYAVLDLGCGTGRHLILAAKNGCQAVGIDLNPHMLAQAEKNWPEKALPIRRALSNFTMSRYALFAAISPTIRSLLKNALMQRC